MRKIFLCFLFLLFSFRSIYADEFFEDGDIGKNLYWDTLGYTVGELLESKSCPNCVLYNQENVSGTKSSSVLGIYRIEDVSSEDPVYGLIRTPYILDRVSLPPNSRVDFIYWSKNITGGDVEISSLKVFLSRYSLGGGDLRKVLYIDGVYEEVPIKYIVWNYPRSGIVKEYSGLGIVKEGFLTGTLLDSVYVKSPLKFVSWEASVKDGSAFVRVYVKNEGVEYLKDISFSHLGYSQVRDFEVGETYMYEYEVNVEDEKNLGYASITNPYEARECAASGEHLESNYVGDSPPMAGIRRENGESLPYIGSRVKPFGDAFCITRIPYTLFSGEMNLTKEEEIAPKVEDSEEVLGLAKLPQTGINMSSFLVVYSILWYYLFRRLKK